jgi:exodeoxyribonuclease VII large subunit
MEQEELLLPWEEEKEAPAPEPEEVILTVSQVNRMARGRLEEITVSVQGEVSQLTTGYAYYVYFDLRDEGAALPAILTQKQLSGLDFKLEDGALVIVKGTLTLYERQGKYQIRVLSMRPFGEGDLQRRIEELKKKLLAEGLFADERKKTLPLFPERIGVITSPRGAAVRDVIATISRRFPHASIFVRGVRVQGAGAVGQITAALDFFDAEWPVDVVILARGGGSLADLEPFNSEEVARAVARTRIPVVTGIGHEPDVTIADLVADRRASTPTGAAEAAVPEKADVLSFLLKNATLMRRRLLAEQQAAIRRMQGLSSRPLFSRADFLLGPFMQRWERAAAVLRESPRRILDRRVSDLEKIKARVHALSPQAVLERGYSITFNRETGMVVRSSGEVEVGTPLKIRLAGGSLEADVTGKERE